MLSRPQSNVRVTKMGRCSCNHLWYRSSIQTVLCRNQICICKDCAKDYLQELDADRIYGDSQLAQKLKDSFKYLSKLKDKIPGVLQGDLLFTDDKDSRLVNNEQCVTFQPNTIVYAISSASNLGKRSLRAKLGIVFHTTYIGPSLADLNACLVQTFPNFRVILM